MKQNDNRKPSSHRLADYGSPEGDLVGRRVSEKLGVPVTEYINLDQALVMKALREAQAEIAAELAAKRG